MSQFSAEGLEEARLESNYYMTRKEKKMSSLRPFPWKRSVWQNFDDSLSLKGHELPHMIGTLQIFRTYLSLSLYIKKANYKESVWKNKTVLPFQEQCLVSLF